jgi:hypothetical protein
MQKPIGGYFEWEFPKTRNFNLHENALLVNSGRHALEYILRGIGDIKKLWIPYFTCDVIFQPLVKLGIPYSFYGASGYRVGSLDISYLFLYERYRPICAAAAAAECARGK